MQLFTHQKQGIEKIINARGIGALFHDVGTGKCLIALEVFRHYKSTNPNLKLFVVCPISIIEAAWGEDIKKFTSFSYANLRNTDDLSADILIINYETLIAKSFARMIAKITAIPVLMAVVDESQRMKSHSSKTAKYLLALSRYFRYRMVLTATAAPNIEFEYFPQLCFLSPNILGSNFFAFRNKYFGLMRGKTFVPLYGLGRREINMMMMRGYKMQIAPAMKNELFRRMAPYCQFIQKRDVLDLPDEIDEFRYVEMTKEQTKAYGEMFRELVTEIQGQEIAVNIALAKFSKCREIVSGFIYNSEGKAVEFEQNPKIKELQAVIEEIGQKKIIIFCQYQWEIEKICSLYQDRALALYGKTENKDQVIHWFESIDNAILVAHPLSAGVGLSFNDCDYCIFFSIDYSFMNYYQCRGRIMRAGKKNNATYIHIIVENSLDRIIYQVVKNKENNQQLFRRIINDRIPNPSKDSEVSQEKFS